MTSRKRIALPALATLALTLPFVASAVTVDPSLGSKLDLGSADLQQTATEVIKWLLAILGLIAVFMVILGGFVWMTAAGNEERVEKAKKMISAAVIGLIIVLLAFAIVLFVANTTTNVTQ